MDFKNTILLTGAGFSANFGGFLAKEMWSKIYNNPKLVGAGKVRLELQKNFDFENVYSKIFDDRAFFPSNEVDIFKEVVSEAYSAMDDYMKQPGSARTSTEPGNVRQFLNDILKKVDGKVGGYFTLNQDLFLERAYHFQPLGPVSLRYRSHNGYIDQDDLNSSTPKVLPSQEALEEYKMLSFTEDFCYIKLHGSIKWVSSDGTDSKIIGLNKIGVISQFPLLKWYFELFEQALYREHVKLLIIGYGFHDEHINNLLSKAASEKGLKIYIISPEDPEEFQDRITHVQYPNQRRPSSGAQEDSTIGINIWRAVYGYFPYKLSSVLPVSQIGTASRAEIYKALGINS